MIESMRAFVMEGFGASDQAAPGTLPKPQCLAGHLLVRVAAAGVNPTDWKEMEGNLVKFYPPYAPRWAPGFDGAGIVEEVGEGVKDFQPGERVVFMSDRRGGQCGTFAEYVRVSEKLAAKAPVVDQPERDGEHSDRGIDRLSGAVSRRYGGAEGRAVAAGSRRLGGAGQFRHEFRERHGRARGGHLPCGERGVSARDRRRARHRLHARAYRGCAQALDAGRRRCGARRGEWRPAERAARCARPRRPIGHHRHGHRRRRHCERSAPRRSGAASRCIF